MYSLPMPSLNIPSTHPLLFPLSASTERGKGLVYNDITPPLYRAERKEIALWAILVKEPGWWEVERGLGGEYMNIEQESQ
jgi:hypothetical protein